MTKQAGATERFLIALSRMHPVRAQYAILLCFVLLAVVVNAESNLSDMGAHSRIAVWEPWSWELTSWLGWAVVLGPFLLLLNRMIERPLWHAAAVLLGASAVVSAIHVAIMVEARKLVYHLMGRVYDFGPVLTRGIYEYRKDFILYVLAVGLAVLWRRAVPVRFLPAPVEPSFLASEKGAETVVRANEIFWVEAQGNYVALHLKDRTLLVRQSMKQAEEKLRGSGFLRTHRSALVNLQRTQSIRKSEDGDLKVELRNGDTAPLTAANRAQLVAALSGPAER